MSRAGDDRYAVEKTLMDQLRAAQQAYYRATDEHKRFSDARVGRTDLDSDQHLRALAVAEHRALEKYTLVPLPSWCSIRRRFHGQSAITGTQSTTSW